MPDNDTIYRKAQPDSEPAPEETMRSEADEVEPRQDEPRVEPRGDEGHRPPEHITQGRLVEELPTDHPYRANPEAVLAIQEGRVISHADAFEAHRRAQPVNVLPLLGSLPTGNGFYYRQVDAPLVERWLGALDRDQDQAEPKEESAEAAASPGTMRSESAKGKAKAE